MSVQGDTQAHRARVALTQGRVPLVGAFCFAVGLLGLVFLGPAVRVLAGYRPPVSGSGGVSAPGVPLTERVILVVLSGVGNTELDGAGDPWRFVQLRRRAGEGAFGTARAVQPSGDAPTWAALLSGAGPSISGIVEAQESGPLPIPTLFDEVRRAGGRSAVIASRLAWQARAGIATPDRVALAPSSTALGATAAELLRTRAESLVVVLVDVGRVGSVRPAERPLRVDEQFAVIVAALDPARDTLIATADHGLLPDGSSGGGEAAVVEVPLVLWGRAIRGGALGPVDQRDVAPTVAALLGLTYGGHGSRPLLDAIRLAPAQRARELVRLLQVRVAAEEQWRSDKSVVAEAARALAAARSELEQENWEQAIRAADEGLAALVRRPPLPWYWTSAWLWGGAVPLLLGLARLIGRVRSRLHHLLLPSAGLALYLLSWCTMYYGLAGRPFSLSAIYPAWNNRLFDVGLWGALALGAVAVGMGMARARAGASAAALAAGWAAAFVLGSLAGLVLLVLLLARVPPTELPNLAAWTTLLLAAAQLAGTGLATPPAMLLAATVAEVIGRGR